MCARCVYYERDDVLYLIRSLLRGRKKERRREGGREREEGREREGKRKREDLEGKEGEEY